MSPAQLQSLLQQAIAHHRAGRLTEAAAIYTRIRAVAPRSFDAVHLLGVIALQQGRAAEAVDLLKKALSLDARHAVCRMRLGLALMAAGRAKDAEPEFRETLRLKPDLVEGWDNLAYCFKAQDRLQEAVECHERSLSLNPRNPIGWYNYGLTLSLYGRVGDALRCHERALAADPNYAKAHFGRAQALQQAHRIQESVEAYATYLRREPRNFDAHSYRLFALNNLDSLAREQVFAEHVAFGRAVGEFPMPDFPNEPQAGRRLRVALISPDFRTHSCAYFIEPLLRHLDPAQFELYLYHDHFREDALSQRFKSLATVWRNFVGQSNEMVEKTIRADQPDIMVDLAGHTGVMNRLPVFARHLAPVQINYLGYPNTTGVPAIRYRLTDAIADPPGDSDALATERLVRFAPTAWCYQPAERAPEPAAPPCLAAPDAPFTFGCFNNLGKITEATLRMWGRILAEVPDARFLFKGRGLGEPAARERLLARFAACGLPPERIEMLDRTAETSDHLALYHRMDVSLDTAHYCGTTTTCESLWMGVPVVTLAGDRHAARVSASLLTAVGHEEWIAHNADDYVAKAVALARDRAALAPIRAALRDEMKRSPLLDAAGQSQRFAAALRQCWSEWCAQRESEKLEQFAPLNAGA
ncbi:MAG: tetratricopeptide repeat protein [Opitutae bacterium]|nr:tetratricopeptide repeat protein [Opitutae bacterium]